MYKSELRRPFYNNKLQETVLNIKGLEKENESFYDSCRLTKGTGIWFSELTEVLRQSCNVKESQLHYDISKIASWHNYKTQEIKTQEELDHGREELISAKRQWSTKIRFLIYILLHSSKLWGMLPDLLNR